MRNILEDLALDLTFYKELKKERTDIVKRFLRLEVLRPDKETLYFKMNFAIDTDLKINDDFVYLSVELSESFNGDTFIKANLMYHSLANLEDIRLKESEAKQLKDRVYPYIEKILNKEQADEIFDSKNNFVPVLSLRRSCINLESVNSEEPVKNFKGAWIESLESQGLKIEDFERTYKVLTKENFMLKYFFSRDKKKLIDNSKENEAWLDLIELEYGS